MRILVLACAALLGCPGAGKRPPREQQEPAAQEPAAQEPAKEAETAPEVAAPQPKPQPVPDNNAKLLPGAPLSITDILRKTPPAAQAQLGEPIAKGMTRESCVRWLPDKTWFRCNYVYQRYGDKTGTYTAIQVVYEDGLAAAMALEGVPGDRAPADGGDPTEGEFDPVKALAKVGLELPGEPKVSEPAPDVKLWSWFNDDARLVIGGLQHRVEVSVVKGEWKSSKVEIFLNHPLTQEQQAKVFQQKKGG